MDNLMDQILDRKGLKFEDLRPNEKDWLISKVNALSTGQLTVEKIKEAIKAMRQQAEFELVSTSGEIPGFITLLTFFIPIIGIIRKWYHDQKQIEAKARIKVFLQLENLLTAPEKRRKEIDQALDNIVPVDAELDAEG